VININGNNYFILIAVGIISVIIIFIGAVMGVILPAENENNDEIKYLGPKIRVIPGSYDFDSIPQYIVNKTFIIENVGDRVLNITGISTSCGCTSAVLIINGEQSPSFVSINIQKEWIGFIEAGKSAELVVTYNAGLHPDSGHIKRVIYIKSNDSSLPELSVFITAFVRE